MPVNGLVTMTPTSIASTGTGNSSSIGTNGSVTFSSCETLSLNGVFTSSYDNYLIKLLITTAGATGSANMRLRVSGTDNSTGNSYVWQQLRVTGTTLSASRTTTTSWNFVYNDNNPTGVDVFVFGPQLTQATAMRSINASDYLNAQIYDIGGTHNQATSYDGFSILNMLQQPSGKICVYGFNQ